LSAERASEKEVSRMQLALVSAGGLLSVAVLVLGLEGASPEKPSARRRFAAGLFSVAVGVLATVLLLAV